LIEGNGMKIIPSGSALKIITSKAKELGLVLEITDKGVMTLPENTFLRGYATAAMQMQRGRKK
jgi:hypothetical protein